MARVATKATTETLANPAELHLSPSQTQVTLVDLSESMLLHPSLLPGAPQALVTKMKIIELF